MLMIIRSTNHRKAFKHLVGFSAMLAFGALGAYGCADSPGLPGEADEAAADAAADVALTNIVIGPAPTSTIVIPPPGPPVLIADAFVHLDPGVNNEQVVDTKFKSPYRVQVNDTLGADEGSVRVSVPSGEEQTNPAICASYGLEFSVEGFSTVSQAWTLLGEKSLQGVVRTSGGEFPTTYCDLDEAVNFGPSFSKLRVFAKGSRTVTFHGVPQISTQNTAVSVHTRNPIPDPGKLLHVTQVALNAAKTGATAKVKNDGPLTATSVRATLSGSYRYCPPPASASESKFCDSGGEPCNGFFCPFGINPSGNPTPFHRSARLCSLGLNQSSSTFSIGAGVTANYSWPSSLDSDSGGCAPCNPNDGRCADISLTVQTRSLDETDPWDTWDHAQGGAFFSGVNE
jgi:hypothetical protein